MLRRLIQQTTFFNSVNAQYSTTNNNNISTPLRPRYFREITSNEYDLESTDGRLLVKYNESYPDEPYLTVVDTQTGQKSNLEVFPENWHIQKKQPLMFPQPKSLT